MGYALLSPTIEGNHRDTGSAAISTMPPETPAISSRTVSMTCAGSVVMTNAVGVDLGR
jgi:hypothetical protein